MIKVLAKSKSGSTHVVTGNVMGGRKCQPHLGLTGIAGEATPFTSAEQAKAHLEKNGWELIKLITR